MTHPTPLDPSTIHTAVRLAVLGYELDAHAAVESWPELPVSLAVWLGDLIHCRRWRLVAAPPPGLIH